MAIGKTMKDVGKFLKNPAGVPQDSKGNYKYIRTNRSGAKGTNPKYKAPLSQDQKDYEKRIRSGSWAKPGAYKKGGKVKKTGIAKVHKGEVVMPKKTVRKKTYSQVAKSVRKTMGYGK